MRGPVGLTPKLTKMTVFFLRPGMAAFPLVALDAQLPLTTLCRKLFTKCPQLLGGNDIRLRFSTDFVLFKGCTSPHSHNYTVGCQYMKASMFASIGVARRVGPVETWRP